MWIWFFEQEKRTGCIKHDLLIEKLQKYGVRDKYLNLKIHIMRDRKQFVVSENAICNCVNVDSGVAQGALLLLNSIHSKQIWENELRVFYSNLRIIQF